MIHKLVDFALRSRLLVLSIGLVLLVWGYYSFTTLPVEAYPDIADVYVNIITQWPGHAAEEVEQQVTIPIESQVNGVLRLAHMRSVSEFGLSSITLIFEEGADNLQSRQQVLEKLTQVTLPPSLNPVLGPDYSPVGQLYFYTLASTNPLYDTMELKASVGTIAARRITVAATPPASRRRAPFIPSTPFAAGYRPSNRVTSSFSRAA